MNFHQIFIEIATSIFFNGRLYVLGQRFLRSVWVNWLENCPKNVKYIFDIIKNGGLVAIFSAELYRPTVLLFLFKNKC